MAVISDGLLNAVSGKEYVYSLAAETDLSQFADIPFIKRVIPTSVVNSAPEGIPSGSSVTVDSIPYQIGVTPIRRLPVRQRRGR